MLSRDEFDTLFGHLKRYYATPVHNTEEFWGLYETVQNFGAKKILEIGVGRGGTIGFWDILVSHEGRVVGVDFNIEIPFEYQPTSEFTLVEADLNDPKTVEDIRQLIPEVDFLFYGIKTDVRYFDSLVRPEGLIALTVDDGRIVYT